MLDTPSIVRINGVLPDLSSGIPRKGRKFHRKDTCVQEKEDYSKMTY
jgi:hypothetical protein